VANALRTAHPEVTVELVEIKTEGDRDRNSPLSTIGGTGLFTKEIQRALCDGTVDLAVHSLKDLPTAGPPELVLAAVPPREDVADGLIAPRFQTLDQLPVGATVGTGSLRRRAQLLHARPDLRVENLRGNVETRLRKAIDGERDGVVLAMAGLRRLGLASHVTEQLGPPRWLPAVGQGALGIEARRDDEMVRNLVAILDDAATRAAVTAERALLAALDGGCLVPLGAWGRVSANRLSLDAAVYDVDGRACVRAEAEGSLENPAETGRTVAARLIELGAQALLRSAQR
jgi:hydroxymethylbilane synthase